MSLVDDVVVAEGVVLVDAEELSDSDTLIDALAALEGVRLGVSASEVVGVVLHEFV